jgi:cytochrome P450
MIVFAPRIWHFSEEYYKDPKTFNPNRWNESHKDFDGHLRTNHLSWSPFGQGGLLQV